MSKTRQLIISEQARDDLIDIWQYIALDSIESADGFVDFVYEKCSELAVFPEMGRKRDDLIPGIRSMPVKRYVIFYRIREDCVEISRVLSAYRDLNSIF
ncbi:MAG: type II toxin-antitoxin system RelE/ParE family toxin [Desulfohalobiaceae bacterium]|nr:type II toxin-antitoxin system RelE/ParE family toxin [Desulfohalobiaceae bacterium]